MTFTLKNNRPAGRGAPGRARGCIRSPDGRPEAYRFDLVHIGNIVFHMSRSRFTICTHIPGIH